jgi:uncharacterized protein (TIGR01777 family)
MTTTVTLASPLLWSLIALQMAMGLFDVLYHHEFTERLPWRHSQHHELALHAARNLLYAVVFVVLGWFEPHGLWAVLLIAVLATEVLITLMDFVEEDMSRKLPASERVTHTLLALNYGAILALLIPVLVAWSRDETKMAPAYYGLWSLAAAMAAIGVVLFGLRDIFAAHRVRRLGRGNPAALAAGLTRRHAILITGATGFIGSRVVEAFAAAGHDVIVLARDPAKAALLRPPFRLVTSLDQIPSDATIDTILNLAGEPTANGLWTRRKRRKILASRLRMTRDVIRLIRRLERRPSVLISGSAIGWYGLWQDEELTEFDGGKRSFSHRLCEAWERAANKAMREGVRVVRLRIGLVLGTDGGMLAQMLPAFEFGLGGPFGSGAQWMSWIERDDLVRLIVHVITTPQLRGAVNATAPVPVTNKEFAAALGAALHRPAVMRMPAALLHRLGGDLADELLLGGQRVFPDKAWTSGFVFRHATLESALEAMLGSSAAHDGPPRLTPAASARPS